MPGPLSKDLRQRVIEAVASGASRRQAARRFGVSASAAVRWLAAWHAEGRVAPLAMGGDRRSSLERHRELLLEMIAARPDTTLDEMRAMLATQGIITSHGALWRFIAKEGPSFKKNGPRQRAGAVGRDEGAQGPARGSGRARFGQARLHRRDPPRYLWGQDQHGAPSRSFGAWLTPDRPGASLEGLLALVIP